MNTGNVSQTKSPRAVYLTIQDVFVLFLNELHDANEISKHPIFVSSVVEQLGNKKHLFELSEIEKIKEPKNRFDWLGRDPVQMNAFQYTFFSHLIVLETVTIHKTNSFL